MSRSYILWLRVSRSYILWKCSGSCCLHIYWCCLCCRLHLSIWTSCHNKRHFWIRVLNFQTSTQNKWQNNRQYTWSSIFGHQQQQKQWFSDIKGLIWFQTTHSTYIEIQYHTWELAIFSCDDIVSCSCKNAPIKPPEYSWNRASKLISHNLSLFCEI